MFKVLVSSTFAKQFHDLPKADQRRIRRGLEALREDPCAPRPGADIKPLAGTEPGKHRLRVGAYRIVYVIEGRTVEVIEVFQRGRGYRE